MHQKSLSKSELYFQVVAYVNLSGFGNQVRHYSCPDWTIVTLTNGTFCSCLNTLQKHTISACLPPSMRKLLSLSTSFTFKLVISSQTLEIATVTYMYSQSEALILTICNLKHTNTPFP